MSILEYLISTGSSRQITWIHGARDAHPRAFPEQIEILHEQQERFRRHNFYDQLEKAPGPKVVIRASSTRARKRNPLYRQGQISASVIRCLSSESSFSI